MLYDVKSAEEYLENLEEDWRKEKLLQVRDMILANGPELKEGIEYKMLRYGDDSKSIFQLNAQKNYVSLYVGDISKVENSKDQLKEFNTGKGCIRIRKSNDLHSSALQQFVCDVIGIWRSGGETDC